MDPGQRFRSTAQGGELLSVFVVNWIFTVFTLGLYYPWAKERQLKYFYDHTELDGHPFHFHGTGKEMFKGFIKAIGIIVGVYALYFWLIYLGTIWAFLSALLVLFVFVVGFVPLVIHGSYRYRMSRSSYRGIHLGYHGNLKELYGIFLRDGFLTIITFGIYGAWFQMNLRNYVIGHVRYGNSRLHYKGDGTEYFFMNIKGYLLTIFTFGIYAAWWQRDLFNYYVDNLAWEFPDGRKLAFRSTATGGDFFKLIIVNALLVIFTFGIGLPWAIARVLRFTTSKIRLDGDADLDQVVQTELERPGAMADELGDMMDIGIFL